MQSNPKEPQSPPGAGGILGVSQPREESSDRHEAMRSSTTHGPTQEEKQGRTGGEDVEKAAMAFVISQGGSVADAESAVEALRTDPAAMFVRRVGDVDGALKILRELANRIPAAEE